MKKIGFFTVVFAFLAHALISVSAAPLQTKASYLLMMDGETGDVFVEKDADTLMAPASMSKLMTLAVLFDRLADGTLSLDDKFPVSKKAWKMLGSKMFVMVDTEIRIEDLIRGIIVQSGNDACIVVAEGISGTEEAFAEEMTRFARKIGMEKSTFANSTGWPHPEQRMTTRELGILARYIINQHPEYYEYFTEEKFKWSGIDQPNRNPLLYADIGADGLKTGHTEESGYGLVGSAVQDDRRVILVVNGLGSEKERATESKRLLRIGFREFKPYALFEEGASVGKAQVWQGAQGEVPLMVKEPVRLFMRKADRKNMKVAIQYDGPLPAPILAGDQIAELQVSASGTVLRTIPLYAAEDVEPMGIFGKMATAIVSLIMGQMAEPQ